MSILNSTRRGFFGRILGLFAAAPLARLAPTVAGIPVTAPAAKAAVDELPPFWVQTTRWHFCGDHPLTKEERAAGRRGIGCRRTTNPRISYLEWDRKMSAA